MFEVKKYKIGDTVRYNNDLWKIENINININTNAIPDNLKNLIELGLAHETFYYNNVFVELTKINQFGMEYRYVCLDDIYKEDKNMPVKLTEDDWKIDLNLLKNITLSAEVEPIIIDYKIIDNTVVIFTFSDGTTEKTVCDHKFDEFDLNKAIELAICKKKFGGTKAYHNAVNKAIKQIEDIDAKKKAEAEEQERIANRKAKYAERQAKRKAKRRQEQIDIQTEAFLKAMLAYDDAMDAALSVLDENVENAGDSAVENIETE